MDTDQVKAHGSAALTQSWAVRWRKWDRVQSYFLGITGLILCPVGGCGVWNHFWMNQKKESSEDGAGVQVLVRGYTEYEKPTHHSGGCV